MTEREEAVIPIKTIIRVLRVILLGAWLGLCIWSLLDLYFDPYAFQIGELRVAFWIKMYILTWPIVVLLSFCAYLVYIVESQFGLSVLTIAPEFSTLLYWIVLVVLGYVQWFIILPFFFRCSRSLIGRLTKPR